MKQSVTGQRPLDNDRKLDEVNRGGTLKHTLVSVVKIAIETGEMLLKLQRSQNFQAEVKADGSPVTTADLAASQLIIGKLSELNPAYPVYTEETNPSWETRKNWQTYWLVDPLDGTQEFIYGSDDYAVSIALMRANQPVLGVIYCPATGEIHFAAEGLGAHRKQKQTPAHPVCVRKHKQPATDALTIALSRRQPESRILSRLNLAGRDYTKIYLGSCALKACRVAAGEADCFYRVGVTGEWDTAAAEIIVKEAGGSLVTEQLEPLAYNQTAHAQNPNFLVLGDPAIPWKTLLGS